MVAVGVWLIALGTADLIRANVDTTSRRRLLLVGAVGVTVLLALTLAVEPDRSGWFVAVVGAVTLVVWVETSARAMSGSQALPRVFAFGAFALGLGASLLADESQYAVRWADTVSDSPVSRLEPSTALVVLGVLLTQIATANTLVRMLLGAVGVPPSDNERQLKGGRVLGPMERLIIVTLGLGGAATAAAVVVAAKGLLRFPELTPGDHGPRDLTEYFLIGSLSSWLVALGGLGLIALARA